ncbi:MAG: restriction endonuclease, SacI family [Chroococcidiopsidaceae cyanobacterium CP_BM_RX_35]|nr:restriction endonuclease, SacI family [Chroococcidiopsidaceae cyanobacterium CP_BM_RX_35]
MRLDKVQAVSVLYREATLATTENVSADWVKIVEQFSESCQGASKTHIAFLDTAMLAKAVSLQVDVFAVKAGAEGPGAFSARGLGHGVLVPHATELGINLGVTGREPLNNQPYFRISRVSRDIPVHSNAKPIINMLCDILDRLALIQTEREAREALRSFIYVRRNYQPKYLEIAASEANISSEQLVSVIETFVQENSEVASLLRQLSQV